MTPETAISPDVWTSFVRDFGLPTFLLLLFVAATLWGARRLFPLAESLVKTHVAFVGAMEEEARRCNQAQEQFRVYLKERDDVLAQGLADVREEIRAGRGG